MDAERAKKLASNAPLLFQDGQGTKDATHHRRRHVAGQRAACSTAGLLIPRNRNASTRALLNGAERVCCPACWPISTSLHETAAASKRRTSVSDRRGLITHVVCCRLEHAGKKTSRVSVSSFERHGFGCQGNRRQRQRFLLVA